MSEAALDRLLAILVAAILATGVLTWRAGSPDTYWLYVLHGLLSGALLAASLVKLRRSLPRAITKRKLGELAIALPLAVAVLASLLIGFAWVVGGRYVEIGPWTLLGWHGIVAWAVLALVVLHLVVRRRWRVLSPGALRARRISRRTLLAAGVLGAVGASVWGAAEIIDRLSSAPRRFTGSRWLADGGIPPPTTFFGEGVPQIDTVAWRLRVTGAVDHSLDLSSADLSALGAEEQVHVLDCTGGWAMRTKWSGVPMSTILDTARAHADATTIDVKSVTGWGASLSIDEARGTFLATGVAGAALPAANGAPCRLVVPNRRGLDWVKWVSEIKVV